ncbi:D-alanyl-D-alanine carboxypeptidase/D-alanyl-D-alanine-endopeptidase [Ornithinibacillus scapharcae]|uniref:D-alanyl-D-alanine carboxypeptidase/D-alanyl-D-alanine endopeptidase n=1 Tax=Ornithinibacillus scapharcae TaxID=1147159 RepID=UPI0009DA5642|nr:D-alanyl-D-alanine carboxypeptidase/D-alanyl-D-alanine-endopeptidase [Ornithinibacillus scapharcae]
MSHKWSRINEFIKMEPKLNGALVGISIRSKKNGEVLYDHMGNYRMHPASNMKVFTSAVGLSVLGEDYTFSTELWLEGEITERKLKGNIIIKGKGDPTLLDSDMENFCKVIKETGITEIQGNIIGDDTWYDDVRLSKDLNWNDEHYYYGAQVSALTISPNEDYDNGTVMLNISPGKKIGDKPEIISEPPNNYITIINNAVTVQEEETEPEITINRKHGSNIVFVEGTIPISSACTREWVAVWEPTHYVLSLFRDKLHKNGIKINGHLIQGEKTNNSILLHQKNSMSLSRICIPFMKLSNNGHGEIIVKELGKVVKGEGSWESGLEVMNSTLETLGVDTSKLVIRDGSGISHVTLIPPDEISKFLYRIQEETWFPSFFHSLPVSGVPDRMVGGTLNDRLVDIKVHAKTGTIMGVSTLSGYVTTVEGEELIFSIMLNNLMDEEEGPGIIDSIVEIIIGKSKTIGS